MSRTDPRQEPENRCLPDLGYEKSGLTACGARHKAYLPAAPPATPVSRLLTVEEVAQILRCSRSTVYALIASAKIAGFRIGPNCGGIRISTEELQAYLDTCRIEPATQRWTGRLPKLKHLRI